MRVGLVDKYGVMSRMVEISGCGVLINDTETAMESLLENNKCGSYPDFTLDHIVDKNANNNIKRSVLEEAVKVLNEESDLYEECLVIYSTEACTPEKTLFWDLDEQYTVDTEDALGGNWEDTLLEVVKCVRVADAQEDIKFFDNLITDAIPVRIRVMFKSREELLNVFEQAIKTGFVDTSNATVIINEYTDLNVTEKHREYVEAYVVNN